MRRGSHSKGATAAKARAVASSSAAEEERPAAIGTSLAMTPSQPERGKPSWASAHATPCGYSPQPRPERSKLSSEKLKSSFMSSEWMRARGSARGRRAIQTARSIAIGRTKPSL